MNFSNWNDVLNQWTGGWAAAVYVLALVVLILIINRVIQWVIGAIARRKDPVVSMWAVAFLEALGPPLRALIWIAGMTLVVQIVSRGHDIPVITKSFPPLRDTLVILVASWFCFRMVRRAEARLHLVAEQTGQNIDPTAADAIGKILRLVIIVMTLLVLLQTLGFSIGGLLAFGGAAGIAVGFAAQSLVANLLGGMTIFATELFKIGDDVILPGTELAGTVEEIGWRATRIRGWDHKPFYVPNSVFNDTTIINHTRMTTRRITEYLQVRNRDIRHMQAIVDDGNAMLEAHPEVDSSYYVLRFDSYGEHALKIFIYAFADTTAYAEYMRIKQDVLLKMADIIHKHGAELALPESRVGIPDGLRLQQAQEVEPHLAGLTASDNPDSKPA